MMTRIADGTGTARSLGLTLRLDERVLVSERPRRFVYTVERGAGIRLWFTGAARSLLKMRRTSSGGMSEPSA